MEINIPKIPIGDFTERAIDYLTNNYAFITRAISGFLENGFDSFVNILNYFHPSIFIIFIFIIAYFIAGKKVAVFSAIGLLIVWNLGFWDSMLITLALVIISTLISIIIGFPIGILASQYNFAYRIIMPILDFMQTMPAFVYLIPAIPFFGLGAVSAMFSTVVFSMPPTIRLTCLGIKQVPSDLIEASDAFGATRFQKLTKIQIPVSVPTIMAGINQTILLSLSMVVISAMIGAGGLGADVWRAIQRFQPGLGFEAGICIVVLAIILDRITQNITKKNKKIS